MKFNGIDEAFQKSIVEMIETADDKSAAIVQAIEKINEKRDEKLIKDLAAEMDAAAGETSYFEKRGYRTSFTANEKAFYDGLMNQSITAAQIDVIPTEIIDNTLNDIKEQSQTLKLVKFAPAGVKKWLSASATGSATWGALTGTLSGDIAATVTSLAMDAHKLYACMVIPKAIRDLAMPLVDRYFTAKLNEVMHDGICDGFINGNGVTAPVGILKNRPSTSNGSVAAKTVHATLKGFTASDLADVMTVLTNNGKRAVSKLYVICNPVDMYKYVNPALRFFNGNGYVSVADIDIEVIPEPMLAANTAIITIANAYTMGFSGVKVDEYKETKALDDADLLIAKVYGNGMPDDDNTAYVFNVRNLEKYVPHVINEAAGE